MEKYLNSIQAFRPAPARPNTAPPTILSSSSPAGSVGKTTRKTTRKRAAPKNSDGKTKKKREGTAEETSDKEKKPKRAPRIPRPMPPNLPTVDENGNEISYTPITHRPSKAKKGKKVHACEHPGCGKVFTRAEHRKRHEANHNTDPAYQCSIESCRKPFQRSDLLIRHLERQSVSSATTSMPTTDQRRHGITPGTPLDQVSSSFPLVSGPPSLNSTPVLDSSNFDYASYLSPQTFQSASTPVSLSSGLSPMTSHPEFPSPYQQQHAFSDFPVPRSTPRPPRSIGSHSVPPDLVYNPSASDSYASSESCYSPMSEFVQPPSMPVSGSNAYLSSYVTPRSHSVSATSGAISQYFGNHPQYGGSPIIGTVGEDHLNGDTYGSLDAAATIYTASTTGMLPSPGLTDTSHRSLHHVQQQHQCPPGSPLQTSVPWIPAFRTAGEPVYKQATWQQDTGRDQRRELLRTPILPSQRETRGWRGRRRWGKE